MKTNPFKILSLTEEHISFLSAFMDPIYLQMKTIKALSAQFVQESSLALHSHLQSVKTSLLFPVKGHGLPLINCELFSLLVTRR